MKTTMMAIIFSFTALSAHALEKGDKYIVQKDLEMVNGELFIDGQAATAIRVNSSNCILHVADTSLKTFKENNSQVKAGSEITLRYGSSGVRDVEGKSQGYSTLNFFYSAKGFEADHLNISEEPNRIWVEINCDTDKKSYAGALLSNQISVHKVLRVFDSVITPKK